MSKKNPLCNHSFFYTLERRDNGIITREGCEGLGTNFHFGKGCLEGNKKVQGGLALEWCEVGGMGLEDVAGRYC